MPWKPPSPCTTPGCPELSHTPKCLWHTREEQRRYDKQRGTTTARGYGWKWRQIRKRFLATHTACAAPGCDAPPTDVDHIVSKRRGGTDDEDNLKAYCHRHHSSKTAREDGRWAPRRGFA